MYAEHGNGQEIKQSLAAISCTLAPALTKTTHSQQAANRLSTQSKQTMHPMLVKTSVATTLTKL